MLEASLAQSAYGRWSRVYRGDLDEAAACLAEAHEVFGGGIILDRHIFSPLAITEMMLALERADAAGILAAAKRLDQMLAATDFQLRVQALLAEAQVMVGKPEHALTIVQDLLAQAPPDNVFATALGSRIKGLAQQALGQPPKRSHAWTRQVVHSLPWRCRLTPPVPTWNGRRSSLPRYSVSRACLQESLEVFERLGARRYAKRARRLLYKLGTRPRSTLRPHASAPPLSPRELEIVLLVADDMTNAEIAERLIIARAR